MYIKIQSPKIKQTAKNFVLYLEKEKAFTQEDFFNQKNNSIEKDEVISMLDRKGMKFKKEEDKFYSIIINPSEDELQHIRNNSEDLKKYTRSVMETYADNFNRKGVNKNTVVWYAKVEHSRQKIITRNKYIVHNKEYNELIKSRDLSKEQNNTEVENRYNMLINKMKGFYYINKKTGAQKLLVPKDDKNDYVKFTLDNAKKYLRMQKGLHIHVIVSRKDITNRISISPNSKAKSVTTKLNGKSVHVGFNRDKFYTKSEKIFDLKFNYKRAVDDSYLYKVHKKNPELQNTIGQIYKRIVYNVINEVKNFRQFGFNNLTRKEVATFNIKNPVIKRFISSRLNSSKAKMVYGVLNTISGGGINQVITYINLIKNADKVGQSIDDLANKIADSKVGMRDLKNILKDGIVSGGKFGISTLFKLYDMNVFTPHYKVVKTAVTHLNKDITDISIVK